MDFAELDAVHQMQPTDFNALDARMMLRSNHNANAHAGDERLFVRFYVRAVLNQAESLKANRAIYEDKLFINIKIPGDRHNDVNRVAFTHDIQRFPKHYEMFKKNEEQIVGTPLSVVPFLTEAQVEQYRSMFVKTVEQLAELADVRAQQLVGAVDHKRQAKEFLDSLKNADIVRKEFEEVTSKQAAQIAELTAKLEALAAKNSPQTAQGVKK